nr:hypothetical protein BaRGS_014628 [Batillaria attramentaria]
MVEHCLSAEKTYFLGCRKFNPSDLANSLWTSLNPNGEFECRDFCQKASYKVSIFVGSDQCLCTDDNVQSFTGVNPQDCDQACAGQEDEYCGGAVHADVTTVTGALYWTVGGCYTGLDIINAAPKYSVAHPQMTPVVCRQSCALQNHHYAALSATNCTCFDDEDVSLLHVQDLVTHREACTTKCDEDASELCGGPDGTTVYSLEMLYESPESCYDLFRLGVRSHGYYVFKSGIHFCYMAAIECPTLYGTTNADILSDNRTFTAEVMLACKSGWEFSDRNRTRTVVCRASKTWVPGPEYCAHKAVVGMT